MILVTGATGFLGKRVCRALDARQLSYATTSRSLGLDLRDASATCAFLREVRPRYVLNCASFVGGIQFGYKHPVEIFENNLLMVVSLLKACREANVQRLVNPISNCAYPGKATLFREDEFWDGPMHESVMVYGFVRKASWVGSWAYARQCGLDTLNLILSNMYGPEDHFDEERSHALGALIKKFADAKRQGAPFVTVWGSGKPVREWLHVDDGAEAMVRGMQAPSTTDPVNVGVGSGISISEMARKIANLVGYKGEIRYDLQKPDGAPFKTVDGSRGQHVLGWRPSRSFDEGLRETIEWYTGNWKELACQ